MQDLASGSVGGGVGWDCRGWGLVGSLIIGAYYCFGFKFSDYRVSISLVC